MSAEEVTIDRKGRVQIPKAVRDKVGLQVGGEASPENRERKHSYYAPHFS